MRTVQNGRLMKTSYRRPSGRREALRIIRPLALAGLVAGAVSGCSVAPGGEDGPAVTGAIPRSDLSPLSADLGQEDWRRAKGALAIALDPQGSGAAVKWDNPDTEISGTFTPVAQPFVKQNEICRAFLATISLPGRTSSLQGTGCKLAADEWQIRDVRPFRKPG